MGLGDWVDERTGVRSWLSSWANVPVPGGARWARALGAAVASLFLLEAVTGLGLAAYYAPTATGAWASVDFIQNSVALGWLLRGLHHYGAHAFVIVLGLHFLQTLASAAFRSPRELNWLVGLALLNLCLALSHTGFLLPGDQRAFTATQIMLGITASVPAIGDPAQTLIQGGAEYGNLTLAHLYAAHVILLPALIGLLLAVHVLLVKKNGFAPPSTPLEVSGGTPAEMAGASGTASSEPYAAGQWTRDLSLAVVALAAVLAVVIWRHGAPFDAPADPSQQYPGRPEWYFYPLFELRKRLEGNLEWVATVIIPGLAMAALASFPWVDRRLAARGRDGRRILTVTVLAGVAATCVLGILPAWRDAHDEHFQQMRAQADKDADEARRLAAAGVPVEGPAFLYKNDPIVWGARVFAKQCASCHPSGAQKPYKGDPCLDGYASRAWLSAFMREPRHPLFFGNTKIDDMDAWSQSSDRLDAMVEFLYAQADRLDVNAALAEKGKTLYEKEGCDSCHSLDGKGSGLAPDLKGYAGVEWLASFIRAPQANRFYADKNEMDPFDPNKLSDAELRAVVAWLRARGSHPDELAALH